MSRRIIPILCALVVAVVPATALAQPAQDPAPAREADRRHLRRHQVRPAEPAGPGRCRLQRRHLGRHEGQSAPRDRSGGRPSPTTACPTSTAIGSLTPAQLAAAYGTTKPTNVGRCRPPRPTTTTTAGRSPPGSRPPFSRLRDRRRRLHDGRQHRAPAHGGVRSAPLGGRGRPRPRPQQRLRPERAQARAPGSSAAPRGRRACTCAATRAGPARRRGAARGVSRKPPRPVPVEGAQQPEVGHLDAALVLAQLVVAGARSPADGRHPGLDAPSAQRLPLGVRAREVVGPAIVRARPRRRASG